MGIRLGICGAGQFADAFIELFAAHPLVDEVVLADLIPERVERAASLYGIKRVCGSMDELCNTDVDSIAIFVQRHLHGPMTIQALQAGKHVYCAVPMASTLAEIKAVTDMVAKTGLVYMNGETSYYYPTVLYCRQRFAQGDFGEFVYGEGNYLHDMSHGFYKAFQHSGGQDWRRVAGYPPMYYPTHSVSAVLSVTGARATQVSCLGYVDTADDGVFGAGNNHWDNPYSNETALMRTSDGGSMRINEFRRIGWWGRASSNPLCIYGTKGSFEESCGSQYWTSLKAKDLQDLTELLHSPRHVVPASQSDLHEALQRDFNSCYSKAHPVHRLPKVFHQMRNGHLGSHQFLVDDFVKAVYTHTLPPVHAWEAAKYCAPGLVAHESALQNGAVLQIPDFGAPPTGWERLNPDTIVCD
jgi:predicted dehydrogenase